jgi:hypothetical protein
MKGCRKLPPAGAGEFQSVRVGTGVLAYDLGHYQAAEELMTEAIALQDHAPSATPLIKHQVSLYLGLALLKRDAAGKAESHLLSAFESAKSLKEPSAQVKASLDALDELYTTLGRPDRAGEYRVQRDGPER